MHVHSDSVRFAAHAIRSALPHRGNLEILQRNDDPLSWEAPPAFDRCSALRAFRSFVQHLEELLGHRFDYESGSHLDETSYHSEIYFPGGSLRFSNFGSMVAFTEGHEVPSALVRQVAELAEEHGHVFMPEEVLEGRYTGRNRRLARTDSWYARFFA